jgi:hypothetical protein
MFGSLTGRRHGIKMARKGKSSKLSIAWRGMAVLLLSMAIAFTSLVAAPVMAQEAAATVTVNAPEYVDEGATFAATIDVDSITDLNSAQFELTFDKSVVKVSDVEKGEINGEDVPVFDWRLNPDKDTVRVIIMMTIGEGVSGSGYLTEIEFEVKGEEGEKSELKFSNGELTDIEVKDIPANWSDTTVTIGQSTPEEEEEEEPAPTPAPEPGVTPTPTPEANVTETIDTTPTSTQEPGVTPTPKPALAPEVTPLTTATPAVKPTLAPETTPSPGPAEKPTPTPTPPGFEAVLAIAVLSAIAYILLRKR